MYNGFPLRRRYHPSSSKDERRAKDVCLFAGYISETCSISISIVVVVVVVLLFTLGNQ